MKPRFRFAPSPNAPLHAGHFFSVEENFRLAHEINGEVLLRIEDIDQTRCKLEFEQAIYKQLIDYKFQGKVRRQSEHFDFYKSKIDELVKRDLVYKDFTTRTGRINEQYALKIDLKKALKQVKKPLFWIEKGVKIDVNLTELEDVVIARKETPTSYHISVVLDDALQRITHVVRGLDLYEQTHIHVLLQTLFNLPTPYYHHHTLILNERGEKLSKSAGI